MENFPIPDFISTILCTVQATEKKAEHWGLWAYVCNERHHEYGPEAPHVNHEVDLFLKQVAQGRFEKLYSHELWMEVFGKNYLTM
ncbi:MAG: hypothetical protein IJ245_03865 [Lachnospiraceae bacterium]|nr:hypothetical protein [Lachnospiraceae bacterium]